MVRLTGTAAAFGPDELLYYCPSTDHGYCEDASTLCLVHGSTTSNLMRPVRYYTERMYAIQDADGALFAVLHPHMQPKDVMSPIAVGGGPRRDSIIAKSPGPTRSKGKKYRDTHDREDRCVLHEQ